LDFDFFDLPLPDLDWPWVVTVLPAPFWSLPPDEEDLCWAGFLVPVLVLVVLDDPLVVVVDVEVVPDFVVEVGVEVVGLEPVDVVVTVGVEVVLGWQEAVTFWTGPTPAGTSCEGGVPGAALTTKVSVWPVRRVTVTVHTSAEAVGSAATPLVSSTDATVMAPIFSLRLLDTLSYSSRTSTATPAAPLQIGRNALEPND
jgi:hypothetical protein